MRIFRKDGRLFYENEFKQVFLLIINDGVWSFTHDVHLSGDFGYEVSDQQHINRLYRELTIREKINRVLHSDKGE